MSKTKAGGCADRDVDIRLRAEGAIRQLRPTSRTFVGVGMAEIIKGREAVGRIQSAFKSSFESTTIPKPPRLIPQ